MAGLNPFGMQVKRKIKMKIYLIMIRSYIQNLFSRSNTPTSSSQFPIILPFGKKSILPFGKKSSSRVMKSTERGLRDIDREGQREEPFILKKSLSIHLTPIHTSSSLLSCPANPTMQKFSLTYLLSVLSISFAIKYGFTLNNYSLVDIYGMIVDSFVKGIHSSDVVPVLEVERFYDCLEEVTTSIADSSNEDETRKQGVILLVGTILLTSFLLADAGMKW